MSCNKRSEYSLIGCAGWWDSLIQEAVSSCKIALIKDISCSTGHCQTIYVPLKCHLASKQRCHTMVLLLYTVGLALDNNSCAFPSSGIYCLCIARKRWTVYAQLWCITLAKRWFLYEQDILFLPSHMGGGLIHLVRLPSSCPNYSK